MNPRMLVLVVALFAGATFAGCLGGDDVQIDSTGECSDAAICGEGATTGEGNGAVKGRVADVQTQTIPGVNVTLGQGVGINEIKTRTNEFGAYQFANLAPGTYQITFSKAWFRSAAQEVTVEAGAEAVVDALLTAMPKPPEPYSENWEFTGIIGCTAGFGDLTPDDYCSKSELPEQVRNQDAQTKFKFAIEDGLTGIVMGLDSEKDQTEETIPLQVKWQNPPAAAVYEYGGPTPWTHTWDFVADETVELVAKATPGYALFNIRVDSCTSPCKGYNAPFKVYMEVFYNGKEIPDGFDPRPEV